MRELRLLIHSGFTLIEVAVVMLIIVILLGIVSVNLSPDRDTPVRDEANRLALLLQTAQQEAILQGKILAVSFEPEGYRFLALDEKREFTPLADEDLFRARSLPDDIRIASIEIDGLKDAEKPRLLFHPTGELPLFSITFRYGDSRWQVDGMTAGKIRTKHLPAPDKA